MAEGEEDWDECCVCLEPFTDPRLLPCHHTFCASCIQDLSEQHEGRQFPCPACRKPTTLPSEGVSALQKNFYIKAGRKRDKTRCRRHEDQLLKFYCQPCDKVICTDCKLTDHEGHKTQDLQTATDRTKQELKSDQERIKRALDVVRTNVDGTEKQKQASKGKQAEVEKTIQQRYDALVEEAAKWRDEVLRSSKGFSEKIIGDIDKSLTQQKANQQQLLDIQQQLDRAVATESGNDVVMAVGKMMRQGRGSEDSVKRLTTVTATSSKLPFFFSHHSLKTLTDKIRDYFGTVSVMEKPIAELKVAAVSKFNCGTDPDTRVFSICHVDKKTSSVYVSFEQCGEKLEFRKRFSESGKLLLGGERNTSKMASGRRCAKGECVHFSEKGDGTYSTYVKSLTAPHYLLSNNCCGRATLDQVTFLSFVPYKDKVTKEFEITLGRHRAVDVDETGNIFIVVEEPRPPSKQRKVLMFRRNQQVAVTTYTPPTSKFQPSDVCFYTLGGREYLLVSDEANDAIHVVSVGEKTMTFVRYLISDCPALVCPTAMNVDVRWRWLWMACMGGNIITVKPEV